MRVMITGDFATESGLGPIIVRWSGPTEHHFERTDYGCGLLGVGVVLMCRDPHLKFKRRVRLEKATRTLYLDVMLDLDRLQWTDEATRQRIVLQRLVEDLGELLRRRAVPNFDAARFVADLEGYLLQLT